MVNMLEPSPDIVEGIIGKLKTNGMFDEMRRSCLADIDTKPAFQNLKQRVENYVNALLSTETWTPTLNKNQLRTKVRSSVMRSGMLNSGVEHILHQVVDAKMYTEFLPKINDFIAENHEALMKELLPQSEANADNDENIPDQIDSPTGSQESNAQGPSITENSNVENETSVSNIPEGAANTLRTLIQSLMTTNIKSLLTIENEDAENKEAKMTKPQSSSPSIHSSQVESFTDDENEETKRKPSEAGPRTPEDSENSSSSPTASEAGSASPEFTSKSGQNRIASSESEEEENEGEDLGKVHSDASFDSSGRNVGQSDSEVVVDEGAGEEDVDSEENQNENIEQSFEEGEVAMTVSEDLSNNSMEDVEVLGLDSSGNVVMDDVLVEDHNLEVGEIAVRTPSDDEEAVEVVRHSHREKKRKHKKHRRRRHSTDEDSDLATPSERDSSEEGAEPSKSRSRKKKKKKRSKKMKKIRTRESSMERLQWDSSSEYKRSSLSPTHPDIVQRHSFIPSPISQPPVRFGDDNRNVKVEPAFIQMAPRFRDPYAVDRGLQDQRLPQENPEHPFQHPQEGMPVYPPRPNLPPRSPPHFPPHAHPRFSPPHFPHGPSRFSPTYSRMAYPMRPGSPPRGRYSPTFEYYRHPVRPRFDMPGPPRSPPHQRRFSPPRQMPRYPPAGFPPPRGFPHEERFMIRPAAPTPRGVPPGPAMRPEVQSNPMDVRRPPMR